MGVPQQWHFLPLNPGDLGLDTEMPLLEEVVVATEEAAAEFQRWRHRAWEELSRVGKQVSCLAP